MVPVVRFKEQSRETNQIRQTSIFIIMKKTYFLLAMLPLWLLSCSSGSDDNGPEVLKPINDVSILMKDSCQYQQKV